MRMNLRWAGSLSAGFFEQMKSIDMINKMNMLYKKIADIPRRFIEFSGLLIGMFIGLLTNPIFSFLFLQIILYFLVPKTELVMIAYTLQFPMFGFVIFGRGAK